MESTAMISMLQLYPENSNPVQADSELITYLPAILRSTLYKELFKIVK